MNQKIVIIMFLPNFVISGAGRSVFEMIKKLDKKRFSIKVICFNKCEYKKEIIKFGELFELKSYRVLFSIKKILKITNKIVKENKNKKIIFVSNHHYANIVAFFVKLKIKNVKIVGIERTAIHELKIAYSISDLIKKKILYNFIKIIYKKFNKIVANCNYVRNEINKFSPKNSIKIYPPSFIKNEKPAKSQSSLKILMVGRLSKEKDINLAIKALKNINTNFTLTIVGRGPEKINLINLSKKFFGKNYKNKIKFVGHHINLKKFYLESDLFLNTSHFEGFSNAIIDALNFNIPVIASNCPGGNKEILNNEKFGELFEAHNENDLTLKIKKFIIQRKLFLKKTKLGKKTLKKYSLQKNVNNYTNLFNKI